MKIIRLKLGFLAACVCESGVCLQLRALARSANEPTTYSAQRYGRGSVGRQVSSTPEHFLTV